MFSFKFYFSSAAVPVWGTYTGCRLSSTYWPCGFAQMEGFFCVCFFSMSNPSLYWEMKLLQVKLFWQKMWNYSTLNRVLRWLHVRSVSAATRQWIVLSVVLDTVTEHLIDNLLKFPDHLNTQCDGLSSFKAAGACSRVMKRKLLFHIVLILQYIVKERGANSNYIPKTTNSKKKTQFDQSNTHCSTSTFCKTVYVKCVYWTTPRQPLTFLCFLPA